MDVTYQEFLQDSAEAIAHYPQWRPGQAFFNTLRVLRPDLAEQIRATSLDPFHQDDRLPEFLDYVRGCWHGTPE